MTMPSPDPSAYHADRAGDCLDRLQTALDNCTNDTRAAVEAQRICVRVVDGDLPAGAICPIGGGCSAGLDCVWDKCAPPPVPQPVGALCYGPEECVSGACLWTNGGNDLSCAASGTVTNSFLCVVVPT